MAEAIAISIPEQVLQSKTPNRWQRLLPPDAIEISFQYRDPAKAQAVANDLGDIMIDEYRKELERHNAETIKLLSSELDETRGKLAESQGQIKVLKQKYRGSLPQDLTDNVKAVETLQLQLERPAQAADNKIEATEDGLRIAKTKHARSIAGGAADQVGRAQSAIQRRVSGGYRDQVADRDPGEENREAGSSRTPRGGTSQFGRQP